MNRERNILFRQSLSDFPCPVTLGRVTPSFGLHRFKQGLRFVPTDDEGFALRGDKRRLLYKGRKKSHRFTILGDTAFEYDCILLKEPESNVITLRMEGAENFDFFRQPDFVKESFLKGSYAVYKKETLIGEGTGKLCHIHRPEIIDAGGRRCWGELAVAGNELNIIIPELWLSEAKYPVVVDPTIGTTTVGSQYLWDADPPEPWVQLIFESSLAVNRFLISDKINGLCTAYMYSNVDTNDDAGGRPILYSDNGNSPLIRKSMNEQFADFTVNRNTPAGWRSSTFQSNGEISSGTYIWFGVYTDCFWEPRFDYGARCYIGEWLGLGNSIPNLFPMLDVNLYFDFRLSMYFTYTAAQNHIRTITQGVRLSDTRRLTGNYIRKVNDVLTGTDSQNYYVLFIRSVSDNVQVLHAFRRWGKFIRGLKFNAENIAVINRKAEYKRFTSDSVYPTGAVFRGLLLFVRIVSKIVLRDYILRRFLKAKEDFILKSPVCLELKLDSRID